MQLADLKFKKTKSAKRVGRGGKRGKTSGRGMNGQKSRSGASIRPAERDFIKKIPKLRGYNFNSIRKKPSSVNLSDIDRLFSDGEEINPETLFKKGLVRKVSGKLPSVKILGSGNVTKKLVFSGCLFSKTAEEKVKSAKGEIK